MAAPEYSRNLDPYWSGTGPPLRRYFHRDGSISADPNDPVWGGHESCYTIVTGLLEDGKIREHYMRINRWPKLSVQRRQDWGWELSNHLYSTPLSQMLIRKTARALVFLSSDDEDLSVSEQPPRLHCGFQS